MLCPETDAGMDPDHKGITSGVYMGVQGNWPDYCYNQTSVFEFYCQGPNAVNSYIATCPAYCNGGECSATPGPTPQTEFPPDVCTDTDGGAVYDIKGTVHGRNKLTGNWATETDKCDGPSLLIEEFCDLNSLNNEFASVPHTCPYGCADGACNPGPG